MKFLLDETQALQVVQQLQEHLTLDVHAEQDQQNGYQLSTLYCDTPAMDVFHRRGRYRLFKFRLRRYGDSGTVFLEQKLKKGTEVRKHRTEIDLDLVQRFEQPVGAHADGWEGMAYHRALERHRFLPVCRIDYHRVAYFANPPEGPVRLTFDREVRGIREGQWSLTGQQPATALLPGQVVCEFKYRGPLPALFKSVIQSLKLTPQGVSKYRRWVELS